MVNVPAVAPVTEIVRSVTLSSVKGWTRSSIGIAVDLSPAVIRSEPV